jgi:hypothetical protein
LKNKEKISPEPETTAASDDDVIAVAFEEKSNDGNGNSFFCRFR